jgi:shikimate kinase/3-dehydroquinate synthase
MMGTGKSALGRSLAAQASVPFFDIDQQIEERAGRSISAIFTQQGEPAFRALERSLVEQHLRDTNPRVVALGGGSLLDRSTRLRVLERGLLIALKATPEELARRTARDTGRPLLSDGPISAPGEVTLRTREGIEQRIREISAARASTYAEAHAVLDTTSRSIDELVAEVLAIAAEDPIAVALGERTYAVDVASAGAEGHLGRAFAHLVPSRVVVVTDEIVAPLVAPRLDPVLRACDGEPIRVVIPTGEKHKTLATVECILRAAIEAPVDRAAVVVGIGGGVVTDIAGLAAALALRGLRWIAVPTTVLAMVDASVGGKTAVDLGAAKNAVGAFHQPSRVVVDPSFSSTETLRGVRSGLAEVVKTALIGDSVLYAELLAKGGAERLVEDRDAVALGRAIRSSIAVKAAVVGRDEREGGERAHLNLGHTVGHALEAEGGFERLTHGEAVALGLVAALRVGVALGVTDGELARDVVAILRRLGLPVDLDGEPLHEALRWVSYDKKRQGSTLRMVLVRAPGQVDIVRVAPADLPGLLRPTGA